MAHWADEIVAEVDPSVPEIIINDSKTPSGRVHVGSLRGPIVHDLPYRAATQANRKVKYLFGIDDYDPLDSIPPYLSHEFFEPFLGVPLASVPSPDETNRSFAQYFGDEFIEVMNELGIRPQIYNTSQLYLNGTLDDAILIILKAIDKIKSIYFEQSGSVRENDWVPFHVICEKCGKIATTRAFKFDGELVHYVCEPDKVAYVSGCGHEGTISPLGGTGKLPWKLEWAARWHAFGVKIEGAGKDHSVAGGSRDVTEAVFRSVFQKEPPLNIPYEFLLMDSKKMSSSKGVGFSAREIADVLPPELLRFLLVRTVPRRAINFRIDGMSIPQLFDEYDVATENYHKKDASDNDETAYEKRIFELAQISSDDIPAPRYAPRFLHVATVLQIPGLDLRDHFQSHKGSPLTSAEMAEIEKRLHYARIWLSEFAPDTAKFEIQADLPKSVKQLDNQQLEFLNQMADIFRSSAALSAETIHRYVYDIAESLELKASRAFQAIYHAFLGQSHGPRAGELLSALDQQFVLKRLEEVETIRYLEPDSIRIRISEKRADAQYRNIFSIHPDVLAKFPYLRIGVSVIRGIKNNQKRDASLQALIDKTCARLQNSFGSVNLGSLERIQAYRQIYRDFGVDPSNRNPSAEALLRRIARGNGLPEISAVVDVYNLTSAETMIPMAAYDLSKLTLPVELRFAESGETIFPIGGEAPISLQQNELVYADQSNVLCWDFNYRDSELTKVATDTTDIIVFVDGCEAISVPDVQKAVDLVASRIIRFAGGTLEQSALVFQDI